MKNGKLGKRTRAYRQYLEERFSFWTLVTLTIIFIGLVVFAGSLR